MIKNKTSSLILIILLAIIVLVFPLISQNDSEEIKEHWTSFLNIYKNHSAYFVINRTIKSNSDKPKQVDISPIPEDYQLNPNFPIKIASRKVYFKDKKETLDVGLRGRRVE